MESRSADVDMENQNVIVAVRVRPANDRERAVGDECIVRMEGSSTTCWSEERQKDYTYTYDHSFWSYDSQDPHFVDQATIFDNMGVPLLNKALEGFSAAWRRHCNDFFSTLLVLASAVFTRMQDLCPLPHPLSQSTGTTPAYRPLPGIVR